MPHVSPRGLFTTPDNTAANTLDLWLKDLAKQIEDALPRYAIGTVVAGINNASSAAATITYPAGRFTATPMVVCMTRNSSFIVTSGTGTKDELPITVRHYKDTVVTADVVVTYIALQQGVKI